MPTRLLGYARVSSAEQALGTSLHDQQETLHAYAAKRGLTVNRMYVEAESAVYEKAERREQVQALMADVRRGDMVLVDKIDRWSRDPEFAYRSVRQILATGAQFFAVGDDCDPSTPQGDSMLGLRVFFAREEHKRIRLRMVGTRKLLRDRGYYVEGLPPWGYRRQDVKGADRNTLILDEQPAERVRRAFRLCIEGRSLREIASILGETTHDRVASALRSRHYLGEVRDASGTWIRGRHPALVDASLFLAVQEALDRRRFGDRRARSLSQTSTWWLRDVARCALCGAKMSASYAGPQDARRHYFHCFRRCTTRYVRVSWAEEQAAPIVRARLLELREQLASSHPSSAPVIDAAGLEAKREHLQRKRARLLDLFAEGLLGREELRASLAKVDVARTKIDAAAAVPAPVAAGARAETLRDVAKLDRGWNRLRPEARRDAINTLARAVRLAADQTPTFDWYSSDELARWGR